MSNLKQLKNKIKDVSGANSLCNSMLNLSTMKMMSLKNKYIEIENRLKYLGNIIYKYDKNLFSYDKELKNIIIYSDFGFCGDFNNHTKKENDFVIGKKSKISDIKSSDFESFNEHIKKITYSNYNFQFQINQSNNINIIHFKDFIQDYNLIDDNLLFEISRKTLKEKYYNVFLEYIHSLSMFFENFYRKIIMKNAVDNSQKWKEELTIEYNKTRQMDITNDLFIVISAFLGGS